jgi:pyruvate dehydrogenase E2 component (dihydrolipoamide acetyltransferase)
MATKVMMEALSPTMEEGRLVKWLKNVGDVVKSGDTLAEVETDKAIMELVARGDGILRARLIEEGQTSTVGVTIGVIAAADEDISALAGGAAPKEAPSEQPKAVPASEMPAPPVEAKEHTHPPAGTAEHTPDPVPGGPVRSSPLARRMAAERGVNLQHIQGTGPGGRVIKRDIEQAAASTASAPAAPSREQSVVAAAPSAGSKPTATSTSPRSRPSSSHMPIDG